MSELGELRASLARAQQELETANERLDALESEQPSSKATVLTPRVHERQRRNLYVVGALSSAATIVLLGLCSLAFSSKPPPPAPIAALPALQPPVVTIPPPPVTVAVPEPAPPPPVVATPEPPRPPTRVARVNPDTPRVRERDRTEPDEGMGSLTIICVPSKCDSIIDNGIALGPGHIFNRPVTAGPHRITLHSPNGQTKSMRVDVKAEQLKEIRVSMVDASDVF